MRKTILTIAMTFAALLFMATPGHALDVDNVRVGVHSDKTRLVVELSQPTEFRSFALADPWRLVIDMPSFNWKVGEIGNPPRSNMSGIRQGQLKPGISRIVVDLDRPVIIKAAFLLLSSHDKPHRLVIDYAAATAGRFAQEKGRIFGNLDVDGAGPFETGVANAAPPAPPVPQDRTAAKQVSASGMAMPQRKPEAAAPEGKKTIVVDAGHGGSDPGAVGANGTFEKHVTLAAAKELKRQLEATGRYNVILTRSNDHFMRLYKRVDVARNNNADLFISLHADSIANPGVRGASIYTLSEKASDKQTALLADKENRADLIAGVDLSHEDDDVAFILGSMVMRDTKNQSNFFANTMAKHLDSFGIRLLEQNPHRYAGFAVLKAPDIPSILIEMGFMSNKHEANQLSRPEYRAKVATAIVRGIDAYFEEVRRNHRI